MKQILHITTFKLLFRQNDQNEKPTIKDIIKPYNLFVEKRQFFNQNNQ